MDYLSYLSHLSPQLIIIDDARMSFPYIHILNSVLKTVAEFLF